MKKNNRFKLHQAAVLSALAALAMALSSAASAVGFPLVTPMPAAAQVCVSCHGADGNSTNPMYPRLAGLQVAYLTTELQAFQSKIRHDADASMMWAMSATLNASQISDVASYFSAQAPVPGTSSGVDPATLAQGKVIYESGKPSENVMACITCHGQAGQGMVGPRLAGQFSQYVLKQFTAFDAGTRGEAKMMPAIIKNLGQADRVAVAAYLESL